MVADGLLEDIGLLDRDQRLCNFVSHTWMSFDHPDPLGVKYGAICNLLGSASSSEHPERDEDAAEEGPLVETILTEGHIWMDFWSVPQANFALQSAFINLIPEFVQRCSLFVVLVPPSQHMNTGNEVDIETWRGRGWCRLEALANELSTSPSPLLVVDSSRRCTLKAELRIDPVGEGLFSCCALNHVLAGGKKIRCDKARIAGMVDRMIGASMQDANDSGDLAKLERVSSSKPRLWSGLHAFRGSREGFPPKG